MTTSDRARRGFLPLPPPLAPRDRRIHQVVVGLLVAVGVALGVTWSLTTVAWSPVDELQHAAYVDALAHGRGIPTVGRDPVADDLLAALEQVPTSSYRAAPVTGRGDDPGWSSGTLQYEAVHGPVYYAAMVPFWWLGAGGGTNGSLLATRVGTALVAAAVVPLTWLLARRLLPDRPVAWLLAPAVVVTVNGLHGGAVSNDVAAMTVATAAVVLTLRSLADAGRRRAALAAGLVLGAALATKMTAVVLVPFLAVAVVAATVVTRPGWRRALVWVAAYAGGAAVVLAPWFVWNLATYGAPTGTGAVVDALGRTLLGAGGAGLAGDLPVVRAGVWLAPLAIEPRYQTLWELTALAALVIALGLGAWRRRWRELAVVAWCGSALPLAFLTMELVFAGPFAGNGSPVGRHLLPALPPTAVVVAVAAVALVGSRWAPPLVAGLVAWSLWLQVGIADRAVADAYLVDAIDHRLAPVVVQDRADTQVPGPVVVAIDAGCPVEAIGVGLAGTPPATLAVAADGGWHTATGGGSVAWIPTYRFDRPVEGPMLVAIPAGDWIAGTAGEQSGAVSFLPPADRPGAVIGGDPVATAFCAAEDADQRSFAVLYPQGHVDGISLATLRALPRSIAGTATAVAIGLTALAAVGAVRSRRRSAGGPDLAPGDGAEPGDGAQRSSAAGLGSGGDAVSSPP